MIKDYNPYNCVIIQTIFFNWWLVTFIYNMFKEEILTWNLVKINGCQQPIATETLVC
jgi:hypothetical protein